MLLGGSWSCQSQQAPRNRQQNGLRLSGKSLAQVPRDKRLNLSVDLPADSLLLPFLVNDSLLDAFRFSGSHRPVEDLRRSVALDPTVRPDTQAYAAEGSGF